MIIRFKIDEDPLQHRIYFLTHVESLEMIFLQYKETCEVFLDDPKIGGDDIDGIMTISVIVYTLTNHLGMPLIYLTADCFFDESEGVYVNVKLGIL